MNISDLHFYVHVLMFSLSVKFSFSFQRGGQVKGMSKYAYAPETQHI